MPSLKGVNVGRHGMGGRKSKKESGGEFWRRWEGTQKAGYSRSQGAAIANTEALERFANNLKKRSRRQ